MCQKAEFHANQIETASTAAKELAKGDPQTTALIEIITTANLGIVRLCGSLLDKTDQQDKTIDEIRRTVTELSKETWLQRNWKTACAGFAMVCIAVCFFGISFLEVKYGNPATTANAVAQHYIDKL